MSAAAITPPTDPKAAWEVRMTDAVESLQTQTARADEALYGPPGKPEEGLVYQVNHMPERVKAALMPCIERKIDATVAGALHAVGIDSVTAMGALQAKNWMGLMHILVFRHGHRIVAFVLMAFILLMQTVPSFRDAVVDAFRRKAKVEQVVEGQ